MQQIYQSMEAGLLCARSSNCFGHLSQNTCRTNAAKPVYAHGSHAGLCQHYLDIAMESKLGQENVRGNRLVGSDKVVRARKLYWFREWFHPISSQSSGGNPEKGANLILWAYTLLASILMLWHCRLTKGSLGRTTAISARKFMLK